MVKPLKIIISGLGLVFLVLASLQSLPATESKNNQISTPAPIPTSASPVVFEPLPDINNVPLQDNQELYRFDDPTSVVYMYITVRQGNPSDNTDHTWAEVNSYSKWIGGAPSEVVVGKAEAILQIGDESGPLPGEVGYADTVPNATIQIRGNSTSAKPTKNYKIEFFPGAGEWRGQTTLDLNKHLFDDVRARNKLAFDLLKQIPDMTSLRTQFVRLFVKDETIDPPITTFVDYGLFTQIEQPNKRFLRNHLLDPDGQLYKANYFEFFRYPEQIRLASDPLYNELAFSNILEIKGSNDHTKLIQMLDDVNNYGIPIEQTFEKYFNADNYFTWLAFNILVGNVDTQTQNFFLYSPKNSNTWYFLPWDYDGSLYRQAKIYLYDNFEKGISNFWGVPLHNRVLKIDRYRQMLDKKVNQLKDFLTPARLAGMLQNYKKVTDAYTLQIPDVNALYAPLDEYEESYQNIPNEIQINYDLYLESLDTPMPFFLGIPERNGDALIFNWGEAYDFHAQDISYHFLVARDWEFKDIVVDRTQTNVTNIQIEPLEPGKYYWRVTATNTLGRTQLPFDTFLDDANHIYYSGLKLFSINPDGEVQQ
jgi:spore coat protein H